MKKNVLLKTLLLGVVAIIMCLSLTGCGSTTENLTKQVENATNEITNTIEDNDENNASDGDSLKLYSDDSKIVFDGDQGRLVFGYEGDKITSYKLYVEYENATLANIAVNVLKETSGSEVKDVKTEGRYVIVEYNESEFKDLTVESVKQAYANLQEVKE